MLYSLCLRSLSCSHWPCLKMSGHCLIFPKSCLTRFNTNHLVPISLAGVNAYHSIFWHAFFSTWYHIFWYLVFFSIFRLLHLHASYHHTEVPLLKHGKASSLFMAWNFIVHINFSLIFWFIFQVLIEKRSSYNNP